MKALIRSAAKCAVILIYRIMNTVLPLNKKKIVLSSSVAKSYSGNPKSIYEYMVEAGLDKVYDCVWFYENKPFDIPGRCRQESFKGLRYLYHMATAAYWIFDSRQPAFLKKRNNVSYVQTWHGTPLKKLALDMDDVHMAGESSIESYKEAFKKNSATWDYLISQNPFSSETFRRAFAFDKEMMEVGYPRNDVLIKGNNAETITLLKKELGLSSDKKVILYAPTWRDDDAIGLGRYRFGSELDVAAMKKALGDEYVLIIKHHYLVYDNTDYSQYDGFVRVFDQSVDISTLYLVSDVLVTDYSSVMFDYSLLDRPMYYFCYDLKKYKEVLRGFYFDFEKDAPGPISETTDELISDIKGNRHTEYKEQYDRFKACYNPWDDGKASEKVLEILLR